MKIFHVNDSPVQSIENEIPIEIRLAAQEDLVKRQERLLNAEKKLCLGLAQSHEEYKEEIHRLVGADVKIPPAPHPLEYSLYSYCSIIHVPDTPKA